eukprot:3903231-Prymnesium_polylepis.1
MCALSRDPTESVSRNSHHARKTVRAPLGSSGCLPGWVWETRGGVVCTWVFTGRSDEICPWALH